MLHGSAHATFELVVIVRIQKIVLTVVLVLDDGFHARYAATERHYRYVLLNRAARPGLEAMRMRSRVSEAEALLDPSGLGGFAVLEWVR